MGSLRLGFRQLARLTYKVLTSRKTNVLSPILRGRNLLSVLVQRLQIYPRESVLFLGRIDLFWISFDLYRECHGVTFVDLRPLSKLEKGRHGR